MNKYKIISVGKTDAHYKRRAEVLGHTFEPMSMIPKGRGWYAAGGMLDNWLGQLNAKFYFYKVRLTKVKND